MARNLLSLSLACLLAVIGIAHADEPEKLVSGNRASPHEFPYAISIRVDGRHFCGGAIIDKQFIITAAHCVQPLLTKPLGNIKIVSGTDRLDQGGEYHDVAKLFVHPQYNPRASWYYDIALIKLAAPMQYSHVQSKIDLPTSPLPPHSTVVVSAWGLTQVAPRGVIHNDLRKLYLQTLTTSECQAYHQNPVYDINICTISQVNVGTCNGDSGSPMVARNVLAGLVSGGIPCALGLPDIFTNVYMFLSFIQDCLRQ